MKYLMILIALLVFSGCPSVPHKADFPGDAGEVGRK